MPDFKVNDAGTWKAPIPWINDGGVWKKPTKLWVNNAGTWTIVWQDVTITYNPADGSYSRDTTAGANSFTITASASVVWNWTKTGQGSANVVNGGSATSITFSASLNQTGTFNVSSGGHSWTIDFMGL